MTAKTAKAKPKLEDVLVLIAERAPALRAAGVLELEIDGWAVKLAPPADDPKDEADAPRDAPAPEPVSLLDDPLTFGLRPGAHVPRFRRRGRPNAPGDDHDGDQE